jgi:ribosomal protein L7/L12
MNNKLEVIEQISSICTTFSLKVKGAEICKVLFNQYIFEEFSQYPELPPSAVEALNVEQKLQAIKIYKNETGLPLVECKRAIENYMLEVYGCDRFPTE